MPQAHAVHWIGFHLLLLLLLGAEWLLLRGGSTARSYVATAMWLASGLGFTAYLYFAFAPQLGQEFLAGYALEESLSIDNLFVFLLLLRAFAIEPDKQRGVLFWGIVGAVLLRGGFIFAGSAMLARFAWVGYLFGALLVIAAVRLAMPAAEERRERPRWVQWLLRHQPVSSSQESYTDVQNGHRIPTVLTLALVAISFTDIVFALDSIPAVLSITRHIFVAYTSNVLAVMGLRSLFFVLAHALRRLAYLHYGLAAVLAFAGLKMLLARWIEVGPVLSLVVIMSILLVTIAVSSVLQRKGQNAETV